MIKFRATWREFNIKIDVVEIDKEIENYIFVNNRRHKKESETQAFFNSWQDAHIWLVGKCADLIVRAEDRVKGAKMTQVKVLSMKEAECKKQ